MNTHRVGICLIPLCGWEPAEQCPIDRNGIGLLAVEESGVESKSAKVKTISITEANSMNIHRVGTYLIPLRSRRQAEHCPVDRIRIGRLVAEEFSIEVSGRQESARKD